MILEKTQDSADVQTETVLNLEPVPLEWYEYAVSDDGPINLLAVWQFDRETNSMVMRWENGRLADTMS